MDTELQKLKNGMIAVIDGEISSKSKKYLDIEITNFAPLIGLPERAFLVKPDTSSEDIGRFDHFSIPSDLRMHLTGDHGHIFFNAQPLRDLRDRTVMGSVRAFTFIGVPVGIAPLLYGEKTRVWNQVIFLSPFPDAQFNPSTTRIFLDFFLHNTIELDFTLAPFVMENMRLAYDRSGCTLGPFLYSDLQRRQAASPNDLMFTIRFGYVEMEPDDAVYLYTPLDIYERRLA